MAKQDTPKEAPGKNGKSKYRILGRFLRKVEKILDKVCEGSRKKEGLSGRVGPGSQIGAGKVKHKARRVGVRDRQWEEGCDRTKKDGHKGVQRKADG